MSKSCQYWLPDSALLDGVLETRFLNLALEWARQWFASDVSLQVGIELDESPERIAGAPGILWKTSTGDVLVKLTAGSEEVIARYMLGIPLGKGRPNAADRQLFVRLAEEGVRDFCVRLEQILPGSRNISQNVSPEALHGRYLSVSVSIDETRIMDFSCVSGLAASVRRSFVSTPPVNRPCGSFAEALGSQTVRVGARLGTSSLSVADFDSLMPGDIILLDRGVDEPVDLTIEDTPTASRCAMLEASEGGMRLRFREAPHV